MVITKPDIRSLNTHMTHNLDYNRQPIISDTNLPSSNGILAIISGEFNSKELSNVFLNKREMVKERLHVKSIVNVSLAASLSCSLIFSPVSAKIGSAGKACIRAGALYVKGYVTACKRFCNPGGYYFKIPFSFQKKRKLGFVGARMRN